MSNIHLLRPGILLLIVLSLCGSDAARACTTDFFYADLKANFVVNIFGNPAFDVISPLSPSGLDACKGWYELVVKINIPDDCTAAIIDTDYEGTPYRWTLNIGDSPTNNGFAGDAGTTVHNAELWILEQTLALANAGDSPASIDNPLVFNHVSLTDGGMKFLVKDQFVSWGQPYQLTQSPTNKILFAIPDTTVPPDDQRSIYAGFNRVISGAPGNERTGCGLRTVVIRFQ